MECSGADARTYLVKTPLEDAIGCHLLNDITRIIPGERKYTAFKRGQMITEDDIELLKTMGKENLYLEEKNENICDFYHEDDAALEFAKAMSGQGVKLSDMRFEGKIDMEAAFDGVFEVDEEKLRLFNSKNNVICATIENYSQVKAGQKIAVTRPIPLYIHKNEFQEALSALAHPIFSVRKLNIKKAGVLITGSEVFFERIKDAFTPVLEEKLGSYGVEIVKRVVVTDDENLISDEIISMANSDIELIVITGGMSVDPDDVTRLGIQRSGAKIIRHGVPILPGSMLLIGKLARTVIIGFPGCGIHNKISSFDLLLPRILAGIDISVEDIAKLGCGGIIVKS